MVPPAIDGELESGGHASISERPLESELRVLIFTASYFVLDGVTLTIRRLESFLRAKGATVKILSTVRENHTADELKDVIVLEKAIKIPFDHAGEGYAFGVALDDSTIKQIENFNPNIVHFTVPDFVGLDGIRWCQQHNVAYVATWHSNFCDYLKYYLLEWVLGPTFHRFMKGFYEQIPAVYVPTPYMLRRMENEWGYGTCTKLREWGRGVDLKLLSPDRRSLQFRESKHISDTDVVILWVGRLVPEKSPDIWLNVVKRLQLEGLPVRAMVVGSGSFEATLSQIKNVVCCGWLSGVALAEAYASSDILLFPSDVETFGNVTLEALASGCACVVEDKCGGHLVEHGVNGYTCKAGSFEDFYDATKRIVQDSVLRKQMGKHARESAWKFERHKIMQQMADNYKDAIIRHRDPDFVKTYIQSSQEAAGKNLLSYICCNYWLIKTFAEPFLSTTKGAQNLVDNASLCVSHSRSRLTCTDLSDLEHDYIHNSRYEDERKGRSAAFTSPTSTCITRTLHYITIAFSYMIILVFIYASFTV